MGRIIKKKDKTGRREDTPFTEEQEIWIVEKFHQKLSSSQIRRLFRKDFSIKNERSIPNVVAFRRIFDRFKKNGVASSKKEGRPKKLKSDPMKLKVVAMFKAQPHLSLRRASRFLKICPATIHNYLHEAGFHPYKPAKAQILTELQKEQRIWFDCWILMMGEAFLQLVAFSDEKWFVLHMAPNRQNYRNWSIENPHELLDIKKQGDAKAMCFVCVVDGRILDPFWFQDDKGKNVSVNTDAYIKMLKTHIIPQMKKMKNFQKFWWQQDGASCHCSKKSLDFLEGHFGDRIISRRAAVIWPSSSPDHNPLDYSL